MELFFTPEADSDLEGMEAVLRQRFITHAEKLLRLPPGRHMRFGVPYHVEDVTRQSRLVYSSEKEILVIVRCFATHKEYEKWFRAFR